MTTNGYSAIVGHSFPNRQAYRNAKARLHKAGLIAYPSVRAQPPKLIMTRQLFKQLNPAKMWNRKWNGIWYILLL